MMLKIKSGICVFAISCLVLSPAMAHVTDMVHHHGLAAGALHPLTGLDHILGMLTIGLWAGYVGGIARWSRPLALVGFAGFGARHWPKCRPPARAPSCSECLPDGRAHSPPTDGTISHTGGRSARCSAPPSTQGFQVHLFCRWRQHLPACQQQVGHAHQRVGDVQSVVVGQFLLLCAQTAPVLFHLARHPQGQAGPLCRHGPFAANSGPGALSRRAAGRAI